MNTLTGHVRQGAEQAGLGFRRDPAGAGSLPVRADAVGRRGRAAVFRQQIARVICPNVMP